MEQNNYAIFKLKINKPCTKTKLNSVIKHFLGNKKYKLIEKPKFYEVIHLERHHFKPKQYQKRKENGVHLTIGELKKNHIVMHGSGIGDIWNKIKSIGSNITNKISSAITPQNDFTPKAKNMIRIYGDKPIEKMSIYKTPLTSVFTKAIDYTMGKHVFDKVFHLALILRIGNKNILLEKNETIKIDTNYKTKSETETIDVPYRGGMTLNQLLEKTLAKFPKDEIFRYSGLDNNCQKFVKRVLEASELYNNDLDKFVYQDFSELRNTHPAKNQVINTITDTANVIKTNLFGGNNHQGSTSIQKKLENYNNGIDNAVSSKLVSKINDKNSTYNPVHMSSTNISKHEQRAYKAVNRLYEQHMKSLQGGRLIKNAKTAKDFDDFWGGFKKGFFGTLKAVAPIASFIAPELIPVLGIANKVGDMLGNGINKRKRGRPKKMVKFNDN